MAGRVKAYVFTLIILLFCSTAVYGQSIVIRAGRLLDPETATVQENMSILVKKTRIIAVGKDMDIPADAVVYDLSEKTVLPGLFDCHTHVCDLIRENGNLSVSQETHMLHFTTVDRALQGVANAREYLMAGFTTIRDMGNCGNYADIALKKAINKGLFPGPNILTSGKIIAPFGGQLKVNFENLHYPDTDYISADTKDEMLKAIRLNIHLGADWIKLVIDDQRYYYSPEDLAYIVKEAGKAGVRVAAHCIYKKGIENAIEGGVCSLEHAFLMTKDQIAKAKEKGIWLVGTDFSMDVLKVLGMPQLYGITINRLKNAYSAGLNMAFGSDVFVEVPGHTRGTAVLTLIDTWVQAEVPPVDIVRAMTVSAAKMLKIDNQRGLIRRGMIADIIATEENPLDNINTVKNVSFVMKEGKVYKGGK